VSADDVDEIYANLCVQLVANDKKKLRSYEPARGSKLGTWLGLLATHAAWDFLRVRRRSPDVDTGAQVDWQHSSDPDPFEACAARERALLVRRVLAGFPAKDREFVELYYGSGHTPEEVAELMGISVKTVYSKKHKIRARLVGLLSRDPLAA
jgi:RNA polymerase sigma-70 factor, ECF subfamily